MLLLDTQTVDTTGTQTELQCSGGTLLVQIAGTFDGATVTMEGQIEELGYTTLTDDTGSAVLVNTDSIIVLNTCKAGMKIRAALSGAGASTSVSVAVL